MSLFYQSFVFLFVKCLVLNVVFWILDYTPSIIILKTPCGVSPHAPVIWSSAICAPSWQSAHGDLCLAILFDIFPNFQKSCKNKHPKKVPKYMTFGLKSAKNQSKINPKSTKLVPQSGPKPILEQSRFQDPEKCHIRVCARRLLAPLGRFWAPFWRQLGQSWVPKSSILT